ncbi:exodeoxyribonuclease III [Planctomycetes bacterium K23_9]|uniref:Exodeoxyribonuclease n=1 Tax=Stieleria marina TaxID=1930275 RepID=A0A517NSJ9_9BACT|nr:Exodeoxyribonuclease [Planctomycetes bacterium K23_9]
MKLVSWNVNGIRAAMGKGFRDYIESDQPEIVCLQETKAEPEQVDTQWAVDLGYEQVWNCATKRGYSGTTIWSKLPIKKESSGIGISEHDDEGRVITTTFDDFHLVTVYTPNSKRGLLRLDYRQEWDKDFLAYVKKLNRRKPVIFCGDLNCAHKEIDLANPKANRRNAGFTQEEREGVDRMVDAGFIDSFRHFCDEPDNYSWWTYRSNARERNIGWRLDYFFVSQKFADRVTDAVIRDDIHGSDHCPVELMIK